MSAIPSNLQAVHARIAAAARACGRAPDSIRLMAVAKTFPAEAVIEAIGAGQTVFGENYVQEGVDKIAACAAAIDPAIRLEWHFIGPMQSNKTRPVATHFDWVHSIDRLRVAERLSEQRPETLAPLNVCIQVNISGEASKSGVAPDDALALARAVASLPRLRLRGLMAVPEATDDVAAQRHAFAAVRALAQQLCDAGLDCHELSMGMSADLEAAVAEGATMVRIGTAIFGHRHYG